jgi:DNA/RNA-binding domain of Phe-tRNA-synthetase-like protein
LSDHPVVLEAGGASHLAREELDMRVDRKVKDEFPDLAVRAEEIGGLSVLKRDERTGALLRRASDDVRGRYTLETLKDVAAFRAYRDFLWRLGIDPTKVRPSSEALIRRVLQGRDIPRINSVVDAMNAASMETELVFSAFDAGRIRGDPSVRFAVEGEEFLGIGMERPLIMQGREVVVADEEKVLAIYPHRDADDSRVTTSSGAVLLLTYGVPRIPARLVAEAHRVCRSFILEGSDESSRRSA